LGVIVLALDTCLGACSAALLADDRLLADHSESMTRGHQEHLAPAVRDLMTAAKISFGEVDRIGITVGPGSFTGLRVGLAFAKGLALALGRPCVGVGTLEALATAAGVEGRTAAVIDAGRGWAYVQAFEAGEALTVPDNLPVAAAAALLGELTAGGKITLVGPGAALLADLVAGASPLEIAAPPPEWVARLAARASATAPHPLYLREPDARPKVT
jgi:tRNA threonylcarbamoyladenosine biosynthesis protein TsaB